jgi:hypothetical protein
MKTKTYFAFRVDIWQARGDNIIGQGCVARQSRQSFRHRLADGIFLTPLTLLAVPTFEFFSDVLHWRTHGHGWVTE